MASTMLPARAVAVIPRLSSTASRLASFHIRHLPIPLFPRLSLAIPAISLNLPSLPSWEEIWDGLLKAVPKKKTSHSKRRHRQMAGKALKDVQSLCRCPVCGNPKRMHVICKSCSTHFLTMMAKSGQNSGKKAGTTITKENDKE